MRAGRCATILAVGALAVGVWWAWAQTAPQPLESLIPAGALVYLEARDFGSLLRDWDGSAEKRTWLASSNYSVFSRSHLFLRLEDAQTEFAAAAGLPADYALLNSVAGSNSVFALYDIGKLEFLYITRLPSARALNTALWRARATYQTRRAAGIDYYIKTDSASQRSAAFAAAGDLLLLSTRESALSGALELLARQARPSLTAEPWFVQATAAAAPGTRDLRLAYNMERLVAAPHFRSYWIQQNVSVLRQFNAGITDLEQTSADVRERRVLLRTSSAADLTPIEGSAGQVLAMLPDSANLYRAWANPTASQAEAWVAKKLFSQGTAGMRRNDREAPDLPEFSVAGGEADLEVRVDQEQLLDNRSSSALSALHTVFENASLRAILETSSTATDSEQVFVRPRNAVVLLSGSPWNAEAIRTALGQAAERLWTQGNLGAGWRVANVGQELTGLGRLIIAVEGNRLILGDSPELVAALWARRNQAPVSGAAYAAGWRHARELPNFERMMRLIDYPEIRALEPGNGTREPMFYSENLASLGRVLGRVQQATIARHDSGSAVRELVVYRTAP